MNLSSLKAVKTIFVSLAILTQLGPIVYAKNASVTFSNNWTIFGPIDSSRKSLTKNEISKLKGIPASLEVSGKRLKARKFKTTTNGKINLATIFYPGDKKTYDPAREGDFAYLMTELDCRESSDLSIGSGADWWMKWFLDGKAIFDTLKKGNQSGDFSCIDHVFKVKISKGKQLIIVMVKSGSRGWKFAGAFNQNFKKQLDQREKRKKEIRKNAKKLARLRHIQQKKRCINKFSNEAGRLWFICCKGIWSNKIFWLGKSTWCAVKKA